MRQLLRAAVGSDFIAADIKVVVKGMLVMLAAVGLTLFAPGLIAVRGRVFQDADVREKLPVEARRSLNAYIEEESALKNNIVNLHKKLDSLAEPRQQSDLDFYTHLSTERQRELANLEPPVFAKGFFLSPQMLLWPAIYTSLGCLLFCHPRPRKRRSRLAGTLRTVFLGIFIYFFYEWPLWTRNFLLGSNGRTVYAYSNYDIDPRSFFAQELTIAGFGVLIAAVWLRWSDHADDAREQIDATSESDVNYLNVQFVVSLQRTFINWIISSVILGLGFIYFTTFFWSLVAKYHDQRYIVSAFLAHSLWALTWVFLSIPAITLWKSLKERRLNTIENLIKLNQAVPGKSEQLNLEGLEKLESLAGIRISLAGAGAVISLILPLLQLFLHKS
jgi:hypothetical protein